MEWRRLLDWLPRTLSRLGATADSFLIGLAIIVGGVAGFVGVGYRLLIRYIEERAMMPALDAPGIWHWILTPLTPALGGLAVALLVGWLAGGRRSHGVPDVMAEFAMGKGFFPAANMIRQPLFSSITIGTGGSAGPEGPIIGAGAAVGSTIARAFGLTEARVKALVACGCAAGLGAAFSAPIAGVLFTLEVVVGEFTAEAFSLTIISSVVASVIARRYLGDHPAFQVPPYQTVSVSEYFFYALLGVMAAGVGEAYNWWFRTANRIFYDHPLVRLPDWLKPAIGALLTGIIGLWLPRAMGLSEESVALALTAQIAGWGALVLAFAKIVTTGLTLGSGGAGGVFAPALAVGAFTGAAFGTLVHHLYPATTAAAGAYALVGMGAVLAAAVRAPITAVIMLFELTADYRIILPLATAVVVSQLIASRINPCSIFTQVLADHGVSLRSGRDINLLGALRVGEAMNQNPVVVRTEMTLEQVVSLMQTTRHSGFPVLDSRGHLVGMITLDDVRNTPLPGRLQRRVDEVMQRHFDVCYLHETLHDVFARFSFGIGRLPVVEELDPTRLVGLLTRSDVANAYNHKLMELRAPAAGGHHAD